MLKSYSKELEKGGFTKITITIIIVIILLSFFVIANPVILKTAKKTYKSHNNL